MVNTLLRNKQYNEERRVQDEWEKADFDRSKMLADVHREAKRRIQEKIDRYYLSYADENGLSLAEGRKRIRDFDVPAWAKKAAEAVQFKDFSPETNEWLKTYNRKMYISRLELLKAEIDIELQNLYSHDHYLIDKHLEEEYLAELKRQAGILDVSSSGSSKRLRQVVDADFYGRGFSDNIWSRTGMYAIHKKKVFSALTRMHTDMTGYRNEMANLMKDFDVTEYEAMRLLRTESARMRYTAQNNLYKENDFSHYRYVAESSACAVCAVLDGHVFRVEDMELGVNAFPMHPNCVLPDTKIIAPDADAITKSYYSGDVIEITSADGRSVTVTPNHIVLTSRGWVRAESITQSDYIINYVGWDEFIRLSTPTDDKCIPTIEKLFTSSVEASLVPTISMPATSVDFKGDVVPDSEINIVFVDSELRNKLDPAFSQFISDFPLVDTAKLSKLVLASDCTLSQFLVGTGLTSDGIMRGSDVASMLLGGTFTRNQMVSLRNTSDYNVRLFKTVSDDGSANAKHIRESLLANTRLVEFDNLCDIKTSGYGIDFKSQGRNSISDNTSVSDIENISDFFSSFTEFVKFDKVVSVVKHHFSGHVYDISSLSTLYIANGIISSNCQCSTYAIHKLERKDGTSNLDRYEVHESMDDYKRWFDSEVAKEKARRRK